MKYLIRFSFCLVFFLILLAISSAGVNAQSAEETANTIANNINSNPYSDVQADVRDNGDGTFSVVTTNKADGSPSDLICVNNVIGTPTTGSSGGDTGGAEEEPADIPPVVVPPADIPPPADVPPDDSVPDDGNPPEEPSPFNPSPPINPPGPGCNTSCNTNFDCQGAFDGCVVCGLNKTCQPLPTSGPACNSQCVRDSDCVGAVGANNVCPVCLNNRCQPAATPTPVPACNVACQRDDQCAGARDGCTDCIGGVCKTPPACNSVCVRDSDCIGAVGAQGACPICTNGTCQAVPTPTLVPACNVACQRDDQCAGARDGCTDCGPNNTCQVPPTPTPTPIPFNPDSCKCDGIEYSNLAGGQRASITSFGKVEGSDIPRSQIVSQTFYLYEGAETTATRIMTSSPIPASVVSQDSGKVRYKSVWQFTMPQLKNGATYRVQSVINCQPKVSAFNYSVNRNVLAAHTSNNSLLGGILNFFGNLLGISSSPAPGSAPTPTTVPGAGGTQQSQPAVTDTSGDQLQLGTFQPVSVYQKTCTFIKFRAGL